MDNEHEWFGGSLILGGSPNFVDIFLGIINGILHYSWYYSILWNVFSLGNIRPWWKWVLIIKSVWYPIMTMSYNSCGDVPSGYNLFKGRDILQQPMIQLQVGPFANQWDRTVQLEMMGDGSSDLCFVTFCHSLPWKPRSIESIDFQDLVFNDSQRRSTCELESGIQWTLY